MKKLFYSAFVLSLFAFLTPTVASAQSNGHFCGLDAAHRDILSLNPAIEESLHESEALLQNAIATMRANRDDDDAVLVIPVVFHVLHDYGPENIPDAQIHSAMEILNQDFRKLNPDISSIVPMFDTLAADCKIEFRLATKDFQGNCTNGIERMASTLTYVGDNSAKLNQWPRDRYLNIWVVKKVRDSGLGETLGYSQLPPYVVGDDMARVDGIVIQYNSLGTVGQGMASRARSLTHEVGHYLNLEHIWGAGDPGTSCAGTDAVDDTPRTKGHFGGCDVRDYDCNDRSLPTTAIFDFAGVTTTSGLVDPTQVYEAPEGNIVLTSVKANGVSENPVAAGTFGFSHWNVGTENGITSYSQVSGNLNPNKYYEFTVTPLPGRGMTLTSIKFQVKRSLNGPRAFAVRASHNGFASNLEATVTTNRLNKETDKAVFFKEDTTSQFINLGSLAFNLPSNNNPALSFVKRVTPVTFRIYAWGSEDIDGSFEIDNIVLDGSHGQLTNTQNYMDYSDCLSMFTEGQKERMRATLNSSVASRNNLWTEQNRINTGTWDATTVECPPSADFYADKRFTCINAPVKFYDNSVNAVVSSWHWTFEDATPSTSTEQNPTVVFNSGGNKSVTLTVTGAMGESTKVINGIVRVAYGYAEFSETPLSEGFDDPNRFWNAWVPVNVDNTPSYWHPVNFAGYSNNTSAMLNAYDMEVTNISMGNGAVDELVSPAFPMMGLSSPSLSFRYAFATQSPNQDGIEDKLEIMYSTDCGATWYLFTSGTINPGTANPIPVSGGTISGLTLVSAGHHSTAFIPSSQDDWNYVTMNFPNIPSSSQVRFKFVFTGGYYPNNFFIDDVNMNAVVGIDENYSDFNGVNLYPNPATSSATLVYNNKNNNPVQISLIDMSGRVVETWTPSVNSPGQQTLQIETADLAKGVYMVNMRSESSNLTLRLLVQ